MYVDTTSIIDDGLGRLFLSSDCVMELTEQVGLIKERYALKQPTETGYAGVSLLL